MVVCWDEFVVVLCEKVLFVIKVKCEELFVEKIMMCVGGVVWIYVELVLVDDLCEVLKEMRVCFVVIYIFGCGFNLLILDDGVDGVVIFFNYVSW